MFLWKSLSLLGVCWGIGYLLKRNWQTAGLYLWRRGCVLLGVNMSRKSVICFCLVLLFGALWPLVQSWLGVEGVESKVISDHFFQFIHYAGGLKSRRSFFHLIWLRCVWVLWNDRNDKLLRNKQSSLPQMLDKVKSYSLWWLKASNAVFSFGTHNWWSNPLLCMGIDWLFCICDLTVFFRDCFGTPWIVAITLLVLI